MQNKSNETRVSSNESSANLNKQLQGVDKAPGEESGRGEQVTNDDLRGKKIDADPTLIPEQPIRQLP